MEAAPADAKSAAFNFPSTATAFSWIATFAVSAAEFVSEGSYFSRIVLELSERLKIVGLFDELFETDVCELGIDVVDQPLEQFDGLIDDLVTGRC